jgi:hypothetical protein
MYRVKSHTTRSAFRLIKDAPILTAALVFPHGIELLSVKTESALQEQQLQMLLQDFEVNLAGVYGNSVQFDEFVADVIAVKTELLLRDDCDEEVE